MNRKERKKEIIKLLTESEEPLTGNSIAAYFHVTRQIIVKDIALIKAEGIQIMSTARGYCIHKNVEKNKTRLITVCHEADEIEKELQIIVDLGGKVLTTAIDHPFYGTLGESLNIKSRKDISLFLKRITETQCKPLLQLTKGIHKHIIEAEDEKSLDEICDELNKAGYLINL